MDARPVAGAVRRRRVFYVPGFDPLPPRRYRELYRREGAAQAALSGFALRLRRGADADSWQVSGSFDGAAPVKTTITVLVWSDLVRASMGQGLLATWVDMVRTAWVFLGTGALWRLMRLRRGPILAAVYPVSMVLAQLGLAVGAGLGVGALLLQGLSPGLGTLASLAGGLAVALAVLLWFRRVDRWLYAQYLWRDFAFAAQGGGAYPAALEARMAAFRRRVAEALAEDCDEVLVVGHSLGAQIAVSVVADLVRGRARPGRPALGLLTLGQVIPMQSFLPKAHRLRADLQELSRRADLTWVDVTAPGDGCCFALCDPVAVSGVALDGARWPLVISAAFRQTLRPETLAGLRWRFFRLHFQYLCAFDNLSEGRGTYDYFAITAGPMTLAARYSGRAPSPGRMAVPISRYRNTTA